MNVTVFETAEQVARAAADRIVSAIRSQPAIVLTLPTGRTPVSTYAELVRRFRAGDVDFSRATFFGLDEFLGLGLTHAGSFRGFLERHVFAHVNFDGARIHLLNGAAPDPEAECERYEAAIEAAGGIDLMLLGIGGNGHIGFNEPGEQLAARTHVVTLHTHTRHDNAELFDDDPSRVPAKALSMGMATILKASTLLLLATGRRKASCVERAVRGPLTTQLPASFLQTHRSAELYLDPDAAAVLREPPERSGRRVTRQAGAG